MFVNYFVIIIYHAYLVIQVANSKLARKGNTGRHTDMTSHMTSRCNSPAYAM